MTQEIIFGSGKIDPEEQLLKESTEVSGVYEPDKEVVRHILDDPQFLEYLEMGRDFIENPPESDGEIKRRLGEFKDLSRLVRTRASEMTAKRVTSEDLRGAVHLMFGVNEG